jgi:aromatic-L-amino-acid/L-tryptophan decarboxylase
MASFRNPRLHRTFFGSPAQLGIVTFRPLIRGWEPAEVDDLTKRLAVRTLDDGYAVVTTTELAGRPVLRFCTIHPETSQADIVAVIDRLERLAEDLIANRKGTTTG